MDTERLAQFKQLIGQDLTPVSISVLGEQFIQYDKDISHSPTTTKTRKTHVEQFVRFCIKVGLNDVSFLTNQFIDQYFVEYGKTHSEGTVNTDKRIIKVFLAWVNTYKEITVRYNVDLIRSKKMKYKTPKALDNDLIRDVIASCEGQDKLMISMLVETGVRVSELAGIKLSDIHGQFIDIHGKGGVDRTVTMTSSLAAIVESVRAERGPKSTQYLFTNPGHKVKHPITSDTIWHRVKAAFAKHGVDAAPHMLRHSFAVNLLQNGCDIMTIKDLLGHEYITTTQQYLRLTDNQRKDNYDKHIGTSFYS